jgi:hypothetical protein
MAAKECSFFRTAGELLLAGNINVMQIIFAVIIESPSYTNILA